ncbi:YccF domain-containing protein, partial [Tetragenococcus halophilus]
MLLSGLPLAISHLISAFFLCITIIGIPVGLQCFKLATMSFWPFGKEVIYYNSGTSLLLNIIWLLLSGLPLAISHL